MALCPPPFEPTFPFGPYLRFTCRTLDVRLDFAAGKFLPGAGEDRLDRWGYDRDIDLEYVAKMFYGYSGASHREGPPFKAPHIFTGRFFGLTDLEYRHLKAMSLLWVEQGDRTRLYDGRLVLEETKPRTRAKFDPGILYSLPAETYIEYYFPVFDVIWEDFKDFGRFKTGYRIDIKLREWDADLPVPA
jgi:hypothetical protein